LATLRLPPSIRTRVWLTPVERRYAPLFALALLTTACALASFAFACATPFAAFAVIAAAMSPLPVALLVVTTAWIVNQAIGFGALHYPVDASTILWGVTIAVATLTATSIAAVILRTSRPMGIAVALVGAYATYELVLFAATPFLGGGSNFTARAVGYLGVLNLIWLIGLIAACEVLRLLDLGGKRRRADQHALKAEIE
jgi:hypothetical protein